MNKKTVLDDKISNKRVILRADFNVTIDDGKIIDDTRVRNTIPTIKYLLKNHNSLIILSHLGRPKFEDPTLSLYPIAKRLEKYLGRHIIFINHLREDASKKTKRLKPGDIILLENVRFHPGEEKNDDSLARQIASLGDVFVNDAFASCHRVHSSTVGITKYLPSYAGLLLAKEVKSLSHTLDHPKRPVVSVIGGAKIIDKIGLIKKQLDCAQTVLLGGGIANTFLKAKGIMVGKSLVEEACLNIARSLLFEAASKHTALILPIDGMVLNTKLGKVHPLEIGNLQKDEAIMDIGPLTIELYSEYLVNAQTIIFNGPMGKYEEKRFAKGTKQLIVATSNSQALSVLGGGDTIASIANKKVAEGITHISTGGGAMLEFIEKGSLPAIDALN